MNKAAIVLALALCVVAVFAQHPRHCRAPEEFEAHVDEWDVKEQWGVRARFVYDAHQERTATYEEIQNATDDDYFHSIHLFREQKTYRINLKTKVCTVGNLQFPFRHIEIPRDAHFVGEAIVGTSAFPDSGVLTTHWHHHSDSPKFEWYGVYTDRDLGCVPVMDHFHDDQRGTVETRFYDVVLGIADPNIFVVPSSCPRPASVEEDNEDDE